MRDELDREFDKAEWLVTHVLAKTGCLSLAQFFDVAATYMLLDDDERQEKAPNLSKLDAKDMAYVVEQCERHQWSLTKQDLQRSYTEGEIRQMRLKGVSLK